MGIRPAAYHGSQIAAQADGADSQQAQVEGAGPGIVEATICPCSCLSRKRSVDAGLAGCGSLITRKHNPKRTRDAGACIDGRCDGGFGLTGGGRVRKEHPRSAGFAQLLVVCDGSRCTTRWVELGLEEKEGIGG